MGGELHRLDLDWDSFGDELGSGGLMDLMKDMHRGYHARAAITAANQARAAREWQDNAGVGLSGMRVDAVYDAMDFQFWVQQEGLECWEDEGFVREHKRDVAGCEVKARTGRAQIVVPGKYVRV